MSEDTFLQCRNLVEKFTGEVRNVATRQTRKLTDEGRAAILAAAGDDAACKKAVHEAIAAAAKLDVEAAQQTIADVSKANNDKEAANSSAPSATATEQHAETEAERDIVNDDTDPIDDDEIDIAAGD